MKYAIVAVSVCLAAFGMLWPGISSAQQKNAKIAKIMTEKLQCSKDLLEGIALSDFGKITNNAQKLLELTKTEEWAAYKTPKYEMYTNEFRRTAENVIAKAKAKNIDGVTLSFFEMTLSCVRCHDYVRDVRDARLVLPPSDVGIAVE